jgi:hypothetical protein
MEENKTDEVKTIVAITLIRTSENKIKLSMSPKEDKEEIKKLIYDAFADRDFKEVVYDAVMQDTREILLARGIIPEDVDLGQEGMPSGLIFDPKKH